MESVTIPERKRKRTYKPPSVQIAVATRRALGDSNRKIARDLGMSPHTVKSIANLTQSDAIAASRDRILKLLPKAELAVERKLDSGDGDLGLRLLEKTGALTDAAQSIRMTGDLTLNQTLNVLLQDDKPPVKAIDSTT